MNFGLRHFGNDVMQLSAPRIWRDFGSALPFQTHLTQTKPVLPLSNEDGPHIKDQRRRQCCHNKHKKFPYRPTRNVSLFSGHVSYIFTCIYPIVVCLDTQSNFPSSNLLVVSPSYLQIKKIYARLPSFYLIFYKQEPKYLHFL
jgi:hypothetical protein